MVKSNITENLPQVKSISQLPTSKQYIFEDLLRLNWMSGKSRWHYFDIVNDKLISN